MPTYFSIASDLNGYVLDIEGASIEPGTRVLTWENNGQDNQLWYQDIYAGVIRSKLNHDYVLDFDDGDLCINPYNPDSATQLLICGEDCVHMLADPAKVLDVADCDDCEGARVCLWDHNGGKNQSWSFNYQDQAYFMIRAGLNGLVLDISGANRDSGADVVMWEVTGADNQLWYENHYGIICSKLNDFVLDASYGDLVMQPFDKDNSNQGFAFLENRMINARYPEKCVDIKGNDSSSGAHMVMWDFKGSDNQLFALEYV